MGNRPAAPQTYTARTIARLRQPIVSLWCITLVAAGSACTHLRPAGAAAGTARFPPMVEAQGPLRVDVVYPPRDARISVSGDSTFIFGSVGHAGADLRINGVRVVVQRNGSFLAFVPVPRDSARFLLEASHGGATERLEHPIRVASRPPDLTNTGRLFVDSASVRPSQTAAWRSGEALLTSVRASSNASVALALGDGRVLPLANARSTAGDSTLWQRAVAVEDLTAAARLVVARGDDTVTLGVAPQRLLDSLGTGLRVARLRPLLQSLADSDQVVAGRPVPNGTYKWLLLPGTFVEVTALAGAQARLRLDAAQDVWVDSGAVELLPEGSLLPRRVVGNPRVLHAPDGEWADVILPVASTPPFLVEALPRALSLTLYGTTLNIDIAALRSDTSLVRYITWMPLASDRGALLIHLAAAPFGYQVRSEPGALVVRVRRPPRVHRRRPLSGLTIVVDPGHPPAGATGPTRLYEGDALLAIAEHLREELQRRGARVVMTRTTTAPVALAERPIIARRANAHAFVSIHLNALPDGVNPFNAHGTGAYYFHAPSYPLALAVQAGMVRSMGLRDLGIFYDNLAVVRQTWMPSVLCEGAFIMIPEQEALLRTTPFQRAYASGVADGLQEYFRSLATH